MDQHHTPAWMHLVTGMPSRRDVLRGLVGIELGLALPRRPDAVAKKKRKRKDKNKKPKLKRNEFGCVDVGGHCLGNSANCCSGLCEGRKPKKGTKDSSVCVAHDNAGICFADSDSCIVGTNVLCDLNNPACFCVRTTGNAGFCGDFSTPVGPACRECDTDRACQDEFGSGAACILLGGICSSLCAATGRRACIRPCADGAS